MADRTINININYKVNGQDVQRAADLSQRAQKATDDFRKSAGQVGQTVSQNFRKAGTSIEFMKIQADQLAARIRLLDKGDTRLKGLSDQFKQLQIQIKAANDELLKTPKALKATQVATQSATTQFSQLFTAVKLLITAGIAREVVNISIEMARLAGNVEGVQRSFNKTFPDAENLLFNLRRSTKGAISDFDLMQKALQTKNFGLPVEKLGKLLEFATAKAQQTGLSIQYITDSLVTGLGRNSVKVFDNLQLDIGELKKRIASGLDFRTAGIQLIEEDLARMGGAFETSATKADQLAASTARLKLEFAKKITQDGGFIDFLKSYTDALGNAIEANNRGISVSELTNEQRVKEIANISANEFSTRVLTKTKEENIKAIEDEIAALTKSIGVYAKQRDAARATIDQLQDLVTQRKFNGVDELKGIKENQQAQIDFIETKKENAFIDQEILRILQAKLLALKQEDDSTKKQIETIQTLQDKLKGLQEQREEQTFIGNKGELDRLQREIILLEDRILKISDNIKWQQQWNHEKEQSALKTANETEQLKKFNDELDKLTQKMAGGPISFSTGEQLGDVNAKENLDLASIEESLFEVADIIPDKFWTRLRLAFKKEGSESSDLQGILEEGIMNLKLEAVDIAADQFSSIAEMELQSLQRRLGQLRNFYDEQTILAGNNEKAKSELRLKEERETARLQLKIFNKEKEVRRTQAIIDGAAAVIKTFTFYGFTPVGIFAAAAQAAATLSQIAIINRQQPRFAKGVIDLKGPGTGTSDSINAKVSKGESIITASATSGSKNLLRAIQNKKIDDNILKTLHVTKDGVKQTTMSDQGIIAAIKSITFPEVYNQADRVYEAKKSADGRHTRIRLKTMG